MNNTQYFLLRRLHSLLGVFPLGVFLFNHLLTNSTGILGIETFEHKVALIHMLGPLLPFVEAGMIFIPLALHIAMGIYFALTSKMENKLNYGRNWAYKFQRWTGWIAAVFIVYHVVYLRFLFDQHAAPFGFELARMFSGSPMVIWIPVYLIGSLSVIYHFANGLCTFCMTWGITVGPQSQKAMAFGGSGVGVVLALMMAASIFGFARVGNELRQMSDTELVEYVEENTIDGKVFHHESIDKDKAIEFLKTNFGSDREGDLTNA
jgi:succinate dehydrogenase cytochrome b subunit